MYLGLNLPFLPKCMTPLVGDTFKKTWSPTRNSSSLRLSSAVILWPTLHAQSFSNHTNNIYSIFQKLWSIQLAFTNFVPAHRQSTRSPIQCFKWCHLYARMIVVVIHKFHGPDLKAKYPNRTRRQWNLHTKTARQCLNPILGITSGSHLGPSWPLIVL